MQVRSAIFAAAIVALLATTGLAADPSPPSIATVKTWLAESKMPYKDAGENAVEFRAGFSAEATVSLFVRADPAMKYLYIAAVDVGRLDAKDPAFAEKAKKLLRVNYGLLLGKVEWIEETGEVRVSQTVSTDSAFSKVDFFTAIQSLLTAVESAAPRIKAL